VKFLFFKTYFIIFFSLKNQLKKHVVSYFCNLQLQYTNKRDSMCIQGTGDGNELCILGISRGSSRMAWK
jgi:hypothetical protein